MPAHLTRALLIDNNQEEKGEMMQGKALTPQTLLSSGLFLFLKEQKISRVRNETNKIFAKLMKVEMIKSRAIMQDLQISTKAQREQKSKEESKKRKE